MTHQAIDAGPEVVAADIETLVKRSVPDRARLGGLSSQVLERHSVLRLEAVVSSEEIVEAHFRCVITHGLAAGYELPDAAIPDCINSSHRAVRRVCVETGHTHAMLDDAAWRRGWSAMRKRNREVDIVVGGRSPRRADLFVAAAGKVVSVEFKYVGVAGLRDVGGCAAQLGLHAAHHARALFVMYSSTAVPAHVVRQLSEKACRGNVRILNVVGPEIPVAAGGGVDRQ